MPSCVVVAAARETGAPDVATNCSGARRDARARKHRLHLVKPAAGRLTRVVRPVTVRPAMSPRALPTVTLLALLAGCASPREPHMALPASVGGLSEEAFGKP